MLGEVRVEHKRLVHKPSTLPIAELVARQAGCGPTEAPSMEHRQFWLEWAPGPRYVSDRRERHRSRTRKPFFAVWVGRQVGVFCGWSDCMRSVANCPDARFHGYQSLSEAEDAFARGAHRA